MRNILSTIILLAVTLGLGLIAVLQFREGNLHRFLGRPVTPVGQKLYPDFDADRVQTISLRSGSVTAFFEKRDSGWHASLPWDDRMDSRAAFAILNLVNTTKVVDSVPRDKLDESIAGLDAGKIEIQMKSADGEELVFFRMGRRTPLMSLTEEDQPQAIPTTYVLPLDEGRKSNVYAVTGDVLPLFKEGFKYLRDYRPFYFNPLTLKQIRLRTKEGALELGRETPKSPWRILKPLNLRTDRVAMKSLLEGLFQLQATSVVDLEKAALTSDSTATQMDQISLTSFGDEAEVTMEIFQPEAPESRVVKATVSDRPGTLFELPIKVEADLVSLSELPLTVNDLRDAMLTNLNIASIRGIAIQSATSDMILITREPPQPWVANFGGREIEANEQRLFQLLKAVTETKVLEFATDAASGDLSPWGLDRPVLKLSFLAQNEQTLTLEFGLSIHGELFARRKGSNTIMRLDEKLLQSIAMRPRQWKHARLWSVSAVDLQKIERSSAKDKVPLVLTYDGVGQSWQAFRNEVDMTARLDPSKARFLLETLENLEVSEWLSPQNEEAKLALQNPVVRFQLTQNDVDKFGDAVGEKVLSLHIAIDEKSQRIFGQTSEDEFLFTLDANQLLKLGMPLFD